MDKDKVEQAFTDFLENEDSYSLAGSSLCGKEYHVGNQTYLFFTTNRRQLPNYVRIVGHIYDGDSIERLEFRDFREEEKGPARRLQEMKANGEADIDFIALKGHQCLNGIVQKDLKESEKILLSQDMLFVPADQNYTKAVSTVLILWSFIGD